MSRMPKNVRRPFPIAAAITFFFMASCFFPTTLVQAQDVALANGASAGEVHRWIWKQVTDAAAWSPQDGAGALVFKSRMWVMEGYEGRGNRKDVWHSTDGTTWHELPDTPWNPRHAASVFVFDNALWMVAGNNFEKDVWKLVGAPMAAENTK